MQFNIKPFHQISYVHQLLPYSAFHNVSFCSSYQEICVYDFGLYKINQLKLDAEACKNIGYSCTVENSRCVETNIKVIDFYVKCLNQFNSRYVYIQLII